MCAAASKMQMMSCHYGARRAGEAGFVFQPFSCFCPQSQDLILALFLPFPHKCAGAWTECVGAAAECERVTTGERFKGLL